MPKTSLDVIDRKILKYLIKNARMISRKGMRAFKIHALS